MRKFFVIATANGVVVVLTSAVLTVKRHGDGVEIDTVAESFVTETFDLAGFVQVVLQEDFPTYLDGV